MLLRSRVLVLAIGILLVSSYSYATPPTYLWSHELGGIGNDVAYGVAFDAAGDVFVTGRFQTSVDFGGGPLTAANGSDIFLAKYDANGAHLWSKAFGGQFNDEAMAVAVDGAGNAIITGYFSSSADFGGGTLTTATGAIFVAKFDPNGSHLWSKGYNETVFGTTHQGLGVAADGAGNVLVTGQFMGNTDFGGGPLPNAGSADIFLLKLDPSGGHLWSKAFGSTGQDRGNACGVDAAGNVTMTGFFAGTVDFGGGPLVSAGSIDVITAQFDAAGNHLWSKPAGGTGPDSGESIAVDGAGNIAVSGNFRLSADFGGGPLSGSNSENIFVVKYDASGSHQWSKAFDNPTTSDVSHGVALSPTGDVVITGFFGGTIDFGGGPLTSLGGSDIFMARYDGASGAHEWSERFSTTASEGGYSVAVNATDHIAVTGFSGGAINFGGPTHTNGGSNDVVVAEFVEENPVPVLFTSFSATARGGAAVIDWRLRGDEGAARFTLYRREKGVSPFVVIGGGDALATHFVTDASVAPGKTYEFELGIRATGPDELLSPIATVTMPELSNTLEQNQPNPFNPVTTITYTLAERASVAVEIFDASGRVLTRLDQGTRAAGTYHARWNGTDRAGRPVASGVYFYRLSGVRGMETRKMVLLK